MAEERNYNEPAVDDLQPDADSVTVQIDGRIVWQAIGAIVLTGFVIWMVTLASSLVAMLAIAFFFSLALDPGVRWFVNHRGWRRGGAHRCGIWTSCSPPPHHDPGLRNAQASL